MALFLREHNNMHTMEPWYDKPLYREAEIALSTSDDQINHVSATLLRDNGYFYRKRRGDYKVLIMS